MDHKYLTLNMPAHNNEINWIKTMMTKIATTILQQRDAYGCAVHFHNTLVIFSFFLKGSICTTLVSLCSFRIIRNQSNALYVVNNVKNVVIVNTSQES